MATRTRSRSPHSLIVKRARVCGGSPTIEGTRIRVSDVVRYRTLKGELGGVRAALPHLSEAQVKAALDYYRTHQKEIDREINEEAAQAWRR